MGRVQTARGRQPVTTGRRFFVGVWNMKGFLSEDRPVQTLRSVLQRLQDTYCGAIGYEVRPHLAGFRRATIASRASVRPSAGTEGSAQPSRAASHQAAQHCRLRRAALKHAVSAAVHAHLQQGPVQLAAGAH